MPFINLSIANVLFDLLGEQITAVAQLSQNLFTDPRQRPVRSGTA